MGTEARSDGRDTDRTERDTRCRARTGPARLSYAGPGWAPRAHPRPASSPLATGVLKSSPSSTRSSVVARGVGSGFGKWMQDAYADSFTSAFKPLPRRADKGRDSHDAGDGGVGVPGSYDHVYIDVNNVLHVAAHHTKTEKAFFMKLFALLDLNMRRTKPQYTVTLALDGPAPIAKTSTPSPPHQAKQRGEGAAVGSSPIAQDRPDSGVKIVIKIDRALELRGDRLLSRNSLPGLLFEISGTRVPGEGEVKILEHEGEVSNPKFVDTPI